MAERTKNKNTRTARRRKPAVYTCKTCGKVAKTRSHLCSPDKAEKIYVCRYCSASTGDPRHVCAPMVAEMKYACKNCGRVTPFRVEAQFANPSQFGKVSHINYIGIGKIS